MWARLGAALVALALFTGAAWAEELAIETASGARHHFEVEIADAPETRARGLMHRRELAADAGMLFLYPSPREIAMWMKNTYIPLDMLFIAEDGRISHIAARATPHSLEVIKGPGLNLGVLEIGGGLAGLLGLAPGDRIRHPAFTRDEE